jgi:DNA-binding NarL/FixJ family response regulator
MPGASGLEAIRNIRARDGHARILVFSMHAGGYVTKSSEPAVLIRAIRSVAHGERAMSDDVAQVLALESLTPSGSALDQLAEREIEILRQIATGATNEEVAQNLNLSLKTVQNYHYMIKVKTGLKTDAQLVHLATECGLTGS